MVVLRIRRKKIYLDDTLKANLDIIKHTIKKDWDFCIVIDGLEGGGKSSLAQTIGFYLDPTLCLERITFNAKEFKDAVIKCKKYGCIIYDEAIGGLSSRSALSWVNKTLISLMAQIRQKNLFIIIVIPSFFELDRYIAVWRSRVLLHTYVGNNFERGFFSFYNITKKKQLYFFGKKLYQYMAKPNFRGRFTKGYIVNEKQYRAKKLKTLEDKNDFDFTRTKIYKEQRNALILFMKKNLDINYENISNAMGQYTLHPLESEGIRQIFKNIAKAEQEAQNINSNEEEENLDIKKNIEPDLMKKKEFEKTMEDQEV